MDAGGLILELTQQAAPSADHALADLPGWDSLKMVRLVVRLEGAIGRELEEAEIEGLKSVADVQRLLNDSGTE
jgi:acyl carrier protein